MSTILAWLGQNAIIAAAMIPPVALACCFFRHRPAVQHALWLLILLKLLTPPLVTWPWSTEDLRATIWPWAPASSSSLQSSLLPVPQSTPTEAGDREFDRASFVSRGEPADERLLSNSPSPSVVGDPASPENPSNGSWLETAPAWSHLLVPGTIGVWIAGGIFCLIRHLRQLGCHARLVQSGSIAPPLLVNEVDRAAKRLKIEAPQIVIVRRIVSPFLWCLGKIRLVWPETMASTQTISRARAIIGHELAHLCRRDHWIAWLELGAGIIWWWNPLFWFVRGRLRETAEMACDALAIAAQPEARRDYAEMLLELSAGFPAGSPAVLLGVRPGTPASFERRFAMILSPYVSGRQSWPGMFVLIVLALLALPHWSVARPAPSETQAPPDLRLEVQPQPITSPVNAVVDDATFTAWGKEVGGLQAGLGYYPDERRAYHFGETARVAVRVKNVSQETIKFQYLPSYFNETTPSLNRQDAQPVQFKAAAVSSAKHDLPKKVELAPGKEIELYQLKIELKPNAEKEAGAHLKLFGSGIFTMGYDRLIGPSSISAAVSDPILSQLSTGTLALAVRPHLSANSEADQPRWFAEGTVVGPDGKPMSDVEIWVHTGMGSLMGGGATRTDAQGRYRVEFQRGMAMERGSPQLQFANITAYKPGYAEKNLNRHGAGAMAVRAVPAEALKSYGGVERLALPGIVRKVDFVMVPAGRIEGRLVGTGSFSRLTPEQVRNANRNEELPIMGADELNHSPLARWKIWLTGPELPPASSVYASVITDSQGRFVVEDIPVGFNWKFMTTTNVPGNREPISKEFQLEAKQGGRTIPVELELKGDQKEVYFQFGPGNPAKPDGPARQSGAKNSSTGTVEEKQPFTAWGLEVDGLQAGLGFLPGQKRVYQQGETAKLVIRIRNVGKEPVSFRYTNVFFVENTPRVIDGQGKIHPALHTGFAEGGQRSIGVDLAPGKEMVLNERNFDLQPLKSMGNPRASSGYGAKNLYGSGKFLIQYERVTGPSSGNPKMHDPILSRLATGRLELEIEEAKPAASAEKPAAKASAPGNTLVSNQGAFRPSPDDTKPEEKEITTYVNALRAAVKNPSDSQQIYRLVIDPQFRKTLHWAARKGDDHLLTELVRNYCGPANPDRGGTSLTWAAWLNDTEAVRILLGRGVNVNGIDAEGRTALHEGAHWGPEMTTLLLAGGADVNVRTKQGVTPLMSVAAAHSSEPVSLILAKGADVNARDSEGKTALMYAASQGRLGNAEALLAKGADVRLADKAGKTALDLVRPSNEAFTGFASDEYVGEFSTQAEKDAEALRALLKRAGG